MNKPGIRTEELESMRGAVDMTDDARKITYAELSAKLTEAARLVERFFRLQDANLALFLARRASAGTAATLFQDKARAWFILSTGQIPRRGSIIGVDDDT